MQVVAKKVVFLLGDESGYKFGIDAKERDGRGWQASVGITSGSGLIDAESTLSSLLDTAKQFVRMLEKELTDVDHKD